MTLAILSDPRLPVILRHFDFDLAEDARSKGCECGGALHAAHYPRKPRSPVALGIEFLLRFSYCCAICRKRLTPASVRFMGRRVHAFPVVVLVTAMASGLSGSRLATLRQDFGVDRRTLERWRTWWREVFVETRFWKVVRARFVPPVTEGDVGSLWSRFAADVDGLVKLLGFLSPITVPAHAL